MSAAMATLKQQMQDVIARLVVEIEARAKRKGKPPVKLKPLPPATAAEIKAYEKYLEIVLPASYRTFLELHNGYERLAYPGDMLSTRSAMPKGDWYDDIQEWKKTSAQYGMGEVLDAVPIANLESAVNWAYLDPNDASGKNELRVVRWLNGDTDNYDNLIEFFEGRIRYCRLDLRGSAKGR
jgi:hypothetical protein